MEYEFRENRLRGYVRLVAEREGVQLDIKDVLLRNAASAARGTRDKDSTSARHVLFVRK
jgi:hypothetical protein